MLYIYILYTFPFYIFFYFIYLYILYIYVSFSIRNFSFWSFWRICHFGGSPRYTPGMLVAQPRPAGAPGCARMRSGVRKGCMKGAVLTVINFVLYSCKPGLSAARLTLALLETVPLSDLMTDADDPSLTKHLHLLWAGAYRLTRKIGGSWFACCCRHCLCAAS